MTVQIRRGVWRILVLVGFVVALAALLMAACGERDAAYEATDTAVAPTTAPANPPEPDTAAAPASTNAPPLDHSAATTPTSGAPEAPTMRAITATVSLTTVEMPGSAAPSPLISPSTSSAISSAISATIAVTAPAAVTVSLPVAAAPACPIETSAELAGYPNLQERLGCPLTEATIEPIAINEFGDGPNYERFMLWFGNEQQIYVLQPDGSWLAYTDTWSEEEPEIACNPDNLNPAQSPPLPRRGFGKLWCTVESVRLAMGTIGREERLCQHAVVQRHEQGRLLACFEDATIRYFRILDDGSWDMEIMQ